MHKVGIEIPAGGRVGSAVFFFVFGAFILFFMFLMAKGFVKSACYTDWAPAEAALIQDNENTGNLRYTYVWQGKNYSGAYEVKSDSEKKHRSFALNGAALTCRLNPEKPQESVLFWSQPVGGILFLVSFMLVFSGVFFGLVCVVFSRKKRIAPWFTGFALFHLCYALFLYQVLARTPDDAFAAVHGMAKGVILLPSLILFLVSLFFLFARRKVKMKGSWALVLFPLPFLGVGLFMVWLCHSGIAKVEKRLSWVEVPAMIIDQNMKKQRSSDKNRSTTYRAQGTYRYTFEGKAYVGDSVDGTTGFDNVGSYQSKVAGMMKRAQKSGEGLTCRVNPANPSEAVLFNWVRPEMVAFQSVFIYSFPTVGVILLIFFILTFWRDVRAGRSGAWRIDNRPQAFALTAIGLADTFFFAWLVSRMMALPPEAVYGGAVPEWLKLLMVPGVIFVGVGMIWLWRIWPRRKVMFERTPGNFMAGSFTFPGASGEINEAVIFLEANVLNRQGRNAFRSTVWEEEKRETRIFCDGETVRVGFAFEVPSLSKNDLQWKLTLTLNQTERYQFHVEPDAWKAN